MFLPEQIDYLKEAFSGFAVDDLGCGDNLVLQDCPFIDYIGFDKENFSRGENKKFRHQNLISNRRGLRYEVAICSWPLNYNSIPWLEILPNYRDIVYAGVNWGGTVCGTKDLWEWFSTREVKKVLHNPRNTLIHYKNVKRHGDTPSPLEEKFGLSVWHGEPAKQYKKDPFWGEV